MALPVRGIGQNKGKRIDQFRRNFRSNDIMPQSGKSVHKAQVKGVLPGRIQKFRLDIKPQGLKLRVTQKHGQSNNAATDAYVQQAFSPPLPGGRQKSGKKQGVQRKSKTPDRLKQPAREKCSGRFRMYFGHAAMPPANLLAVLSNNNTSPKNAMSPYHTTPVCFPEKNLFFFLHVQQKVC